MEFATTLFELLSIVCDAPLKTFSLKYLHNDCLMFAFVTIFELLFILVS